MRIQQLKETEGSKWIVVQTPLQNMHKSFVKIRKQTQEYFLGVTLAQNQVGRNVCQWPFSW